MQIANPTKAFLALVTIFCLTFLMAIGRIPAEAGLGVLGTIVGYVVGNGIGSKNGQINPVLTVKHPQKSEEGKP